MINVAARLTTLVPGSPLLHDPYDVFLSNHILVTPSLPLIPRDVCRTDGSPYVLIDLGPSTRATVVTRSRNP